MDVSLENKNNYYQDIGKETGDSALETNEMDSKISLSDEIDMENNLFKAKPTESGLSQLRENTDIKEIQSSDKNGKGQTTEDVDKKLHDVIYDVDISAINAQVDDDKKTTEKISAEDAAQSEGKVENESGNLKKNEKKTDVTDVFGTGELIKEVT